jgi:hypothetical protein
MKKLPLTCLAALAALVTGCPHNEYVVALTPRGNSLERNLVFYRADGADTNGVPNYQGFPSNELVAITALYPPGAVTGDGAPYAAKGEFAETMPGDVGGAGSYKSFATSLGNAGFYSERFRGNDDLAAMVRERLDAANELTDLVVGWSRKEFGHEPDYKNLRRFLDVDFRRDLKNLAMYSWSGAVSATYKPEAGEEFIVRFGQYLVERGYVKLKDAPDLVQIIQGKEDSRLQLLIQRFVATKLGLPESGPMPKSLAFIADSHAFQKSWDEYMAATDIYRTRLRQWEKEKKVKPDLNKPEPSQITSELFEKFSGLDFDFFGNHANDHLTVKLSLPAAPIHTNGKWNEAQRRVIWESDLEEKEKGARLPVFCYASWSNPDDEFQQQHFGRVILGGDELLKYCLWREGLDELQRNEWEKLLSGLRPGGELTNQLDAFQFSGGTPQNSSAADFGKGLIKPALEQKP